MPLPSPATTADKTRIEQGLVVPAVANALPDFVLAAAFACAWIRPDLLPSGLARNLLITLLLEFIVLHSAAFMGTVAYGAAPREQRALSILGLGALYSLFTLGFVFGFHTWWPMVSFWLLVTNRLGGVLLRQAPSGEEAAFVTRGWAGGTACYLLAVGISTFLPVPRLGLDADAVNALHLSGGGLWIHSPWHAFAGGALYFALVAWNELHGWSAFRTRTTPRQTLTTTAR